MKAKRSRPRIVGYEILRRVEPGEAPGYPLDPRKDRVVLGAQEKKYLVPPDVDVFELGLIDRPGPHELLPVDEDDKPLWDEPGAARFSEISCARSGTRRSASVGSRIRSRTPAPGSLETVASPARAR